MEKPVGEDTTDDERFGAAGARRAATNGTQKGV
jgi:hypothetical protein